jgi:hypothetical protein
VPRIIWALLPFLFIPLKAAAAVSPMPTGITVTPALITAQVGSKQHQTSATIGIRNNFDVPITISVSLNGFDIQNNALVPNVAADKPLSGVVSLSPSSIVLPVGASRNITVVVHDIPALSPGGHYLSILLAETATDASVSAGQVSFRPAVSATLYVIKEDGAVRKITASKLILKRSLFSLPSVVNITYNNDGNVTAVPRGVLQILTASGYGVVAQGIVNRRSAPVYPAAAITLQTVLKQLRPSLVPGRYRAVLQYRYDGQEISQELSQTFWYIPKLFIVIISIVIAIFGLAIWPENRRRLQRQLKLMHRVKRQPFVAPKVPHSAQIMQKSEARRKPYSQRRKIDDIIRPK